MTTNPNVLNWVNEIKELAKPEKLIWVDGSKTQIAELRKLALDDGIIHELNQEKQSGCYLHRTTVADAARTEQRTFICCDKKDDAGATNNWSSPDEMYSKLNTFFDGIMADRTMYVIPFCMGNPGSPFCKVGIEITDSVYVVLNTLILAKCGAEAIKLLNDDENIEWFKGVHSTGVPPTGEDNRYICYFPQDNAVWSVNTGFGVNSFFSREAMSLRLASYKAKEEGWLAEHMAIIEVQDGDGDLTYLAVSFPTGCGKTSLAMSEIPEMYAKKGFKIRCISDDIAWLRKGKDGRLWAINPEAGVFGSVNGVNFEKTPDLLAFAQKDSIFTNTAYNANDNTAWWEELGVPAVDDGESVNIIDWREQPFELPDDINELVADKEQDDDDELELELMDDAMSELGDEDEDGDIDDDDAVDGNGIDDETDDEDDLKKAALAIAKAHGSKRATHSNCRFASPLTGYKNLSEQYNNSAGVPISAIIFGSKRSKIVPLVYQSFDWKHGVFIGSVMGIETKVGSSTVKRDPMAMQAYCGYNMTEYWRHWLKMGKKLGRNAPKIFNVNWFKLGDGGKLMWSGFAENIRVLEWIIKRVKAKDRPSIIETPVGYIPKMEDINIEGLINPCPAAIRDIAPLIIGNDDNDFDADPISEIEIEIDKKLNQSEKSESVENDVILDNPKKSEDSLKEEVAQIVESVDEVKAEEKVEEVEFTVESLRNLFIIEKALWKKDVNSIKQFYAKFGSQLPEELKEQLIDLEKRLMNS